MDRANRHTGMTYELNAQGVLGRWPVVRHPSRAKLNELIGRELALDKHTAINRCNHSWYINEGEFKHMRNGKPGGSGGAVGYSRTKELPSQAEVHKYLDSLLAGKTNWESLMELYD